MAYYITIGHRSKKFSFRKNKPPYESIDQRNVRYIVDRRIGGFNHMGLVQQLAIAKALDHIWNAQLLRFHN